jgi:hypothetical protein
MEKRCLFEGGHKINPAMAIEAKVLIVTKADQNLKVEEINSATIARWIITFITECCKLKNKRRELEHIEKKVNPVLKVMLLLLLLRQIILLVICLLLLVDVQIVMMNGFLIPLLIFIYALIEIGLSPMILSKVEVLLDSVMTVHVILLALDLFKLRCMMALSEH